MSKHRNFYAKMHNMRKEDLLKLAVNMAEHIERYSPYGLDKFDDTYNYYSDVQTKDEETVRSLVRKLKELIPIVEKWYFPDHIVGAACVERRTTQQMKQFLVYAYGEPLTPLQGKQIENMIRLVLSISGFVNQSNKVKVDGQLIHVRKWGFIKAMQATPADLLANFNLRMK